MIQSCQQFEQRMQDLMDARIDPETDEALCAHSTVCSTCYDSLMAFSLLHTSYWNDSDSMKIKLENLGLDESLLRKREQPNRRHLFAVAASIAAMVLLMIALTTGKLNDRWEIQSVAQLTTPVSQVDIKHAPVDIASFVRIKDRLASNEILSYSNGLPGLPPFKALSVCLDWFQKSWLRIPTSENDSPDIGRAINLNLNQQYSSYLQLAARS